MTARFTGGVVLETPRLALEPLTRAHAAEMFEALADPELYTYLPLSLPESVEALAERYARLARGYPDTEDELWLNWVVRDRATGAAIGHVQATIYEDLTADLTCVLAAGSWGRGFASEALRAALGELWGRHGVERVEIALDNRNLRGALVAERLGFSVVDVREARDYHTARPTSEVLLALTRPAGTRVRG